MPTHQPLRACHASVSAPSRSLELGSRVILARCPDRSVKKEEEMFLYLECSHFISRIYSRSNTRITSRSGPAVATPWITICGSRIRGCNGASSMADSISCGLIVVVMADPVLRWHHIMVVDHYRGGG
ncbi:unnamed protein product [Pleuronectes platessa]|uniref:Uncharacterized protein n=1 Tax=Pleuronectes platessa TaxID=8262 RepID=A0A9N7UWE6_PLEPL|nr:unnamed protein product [Pleuronectes platessa]